MAFEEKEKRKLEWVRQMRFNSATEQPMGPHRKRNERTGAILDDHPPVTNDWLKLGRDIKQFLRRIRRKN